MLRHLQEQQRLIESSLLQAAACTAYLSTMEKLDPAARGNSEYLCPRCREGRLRRIQGKNGSFWGCTNYPQCTATFDDQRGKPLLQ